MPSDDGDPKGSQETELRADGGRNEPVEEECYSPEEAYRLVTTLDVRLALQVRAICWTRWSPDPDELWADACWRIRKGERSVPRARPLGKTLQGILASIADEYRRKDRRKVDVEAVAETLKTDTPSPEEQVVARDMRKHMERKVLALFGDDPIGAAVVRGIFAGHDGGAALDGEELRERVGLSEDEWPSVRRRVRRTIKKAFPRGWSS